MERCILLRVLFMAIVAGLLGGGAVPCWGGSLSADTEACLDCHKTATPDIVADWERSRHAITSPEEALKKQGLQRRVSAEGIPATLKKSSVGCAECHTLNAGRHKDSFDHEGYEVHVVVTPVDCALCHSVEADQYSKNMMSHAYGNLVNNSVYRDLMQSINGVMSFEDNTLNVTAPDEATNEDSCLSCHGTAMEVKGKVSRETEAGTMEFPILSGWPNQGVGRINPDESRGCCTACHVRHQFSIEMARKPYTCSQCHKGPDVPAHKVYSVSKHGNIFNSLEKEWDFLPVPWTLGKDLTAPTCATCHISLLVDSQGQVIAERTHQVSDRLPWRIFGVIYAHAHPKSPDTSIIRNKAGLPLPTEFTGEPAEDFLIDSKEQNTRRENMQRICSACHVRGWVEGHWARFENTIKTSDAMTLSATQILLTAWDKGLAKGIAQKDSIFNEPIEMRWVEQWLFFANSTRFASAMLGTDYGAFESGRWDLSRNVREMKEWLDTHWSAHK